MKTKKIPARALRFDASVEVGEKPAADSLPEGDAKGTVPVTLKARSGGIVNHWWFGRAVHDFAGMKPAADKLPLDYCHFCDEVIGFSDKQDASSGDLMMSGQLVPFTAEDRASEVIHKAKLGVPYQASIYFDPEALVIEEVSAGMKASANGQEFDGPVTIFRQWQLRGAAVCPYGMDANTSVQFSATPNSLIGEVEIKCVGEMSAPTEATEVPVETVEAEKTEAAVEPVTEPVTEPVVEPVTEQAVEPVTEPVVEPVVVETEVKPTTELAAVKPVAPPVHEGKKFLTAFGDRGGKWFAEGKSFDEAQALYTKSLADEVTALKKANAEQAALLAANRGEQTPLAFSSAEETVAPKDRKPVQVMPDGMAKFAANIKMPRS
jgi:hypothetical protein